jgi:hypothetical protein
MWQRLTRRLGHDDNPLRRRVDVVEAWLAPVAIVVFLALCPLVLSVTGTWMRAANTSEQHLQAGWRPVHGVLLQSVPGPQQPNHGMNSWITWVPARWSEAGIEHQGVVPAEAGSRVGSAITVWLDRAGKVHMPPLTPGAAGSRVLEARIVGLAVLAVLLAIMVLLIRRLLDRRRLADWGSAWHSVGPTWSRHR